jgi:hypothetical protein
MRRYLSADALLAQDSPLASTRAAAAAQWDATTSHRWRKRLPRPAPIEGTISFPYNGPVKNWRSDEQEYRHEVARSGLAVQITKAATGILTVSVTGFAMSPVMFSSQVPEGGQNMPVSVTWKNGIARLYLDGQPAGSSWYLKLPDAQ